MDKNFIDLYKKNFIPTYAPLEVVFTRGDGAYLFDIDNKKYLDFAAGVAVSSLGHSHHKLRQALHKQIDELLHVSNIFMNKKAIELANLITQRTFADQVFFCSSGLEANEAALKLARRYSLEKFGAYKNKIISFKNSFHGRSLFTVSVGGQPKYAQGFGDLPKDILHCEYNDIDSVKKVIGADTCALIVEPVQGEGGVIPANKKFLQDLRILCDKHNVVLIFDEVQTGLGRCGHLYAYESYEVEPDLLTSAKGLGAGIPIGALLAKKTIGESFKVGSHGSTYGGNPFAATAALVAFEYFSDARNLSHIRDLGAYLESKLIALKQEFSNFIEAIRYKGLLFGVDLNPGYKNSSAILQKACLDEGLLVLRAGENTLRVAPPLIITKNEADLAIDLLKKAIEKTLEKLEKT